MHGKCSPSSSLIILRVRNSEGTNDGVRLQDTCVHVVRMGFAGEMWPFFKPNFANMENYLKENELPYKAVVGFIPTGWADSSNYNKRNAVMKCVSILFSRLVCVFLFCVCCVFLPGWKPGKGEFFRYD